MRAEHEAAGAPGASEAPRRSSRRRSRLVLGVAAALTVAAACLALFVRLRSPGPTLSVRPPGGNIVYADIEGWYGRSPAEVAVRTPFTLTLGGLPEGLPMSIGAWRGEDRPHDPAIDTWLDSPEVSIERTYRRSDGSLIWLSLFGSRGTKSYRLFEHTPESCYPLGGWSIDRFDVVKLPRGPRPLPVNFGVARNGAQQLVFVHLYLWDSPSRDPERGVISLRLASPVRSTPEATANALSGSFLALLFPSTLAWRRF